MSVHDFYQRLTAAALLGTERQAPPSAAGTPLAELLPDSPNREEALLNAAALAQGYLGAGWQAPQSPHSPQSPAPADLWPQVSDAQHHIFREVFSVKTELLPELLGLMAAAKVRPVRGWVHRVIEEGQRQPALRPVALQVMDERGRWAAKYLEFGGWVTPSSLPDSIWDDGNLTERVAYLQELRGRDPAAARAKLEESWNGENHEAKAKFLEVLEQGLSLNDEPFLEKALDDKRKEVRGVAQQLLGSMSNSQLTQRMIARVEPLIDFKPAGLLGLKKAELEVTLPEQFEKAWARDGVDQKNMPYGMGEKAWWLQQMLGAVPPSLWNKWKVKPIEIIKLGGKEWEGILKSALYEATMRFRDAEWAITLMSYYDDYTTERFVKVLSEEQVTDLALHRLRSDTRVLSPDSLEWRYIRACPIPWSEEMQTLFTKRLLISLTNWSKLKDPAWRVSSFLPMLAVCAPISALAAIPEDLQSTFRQPDHRLFNEFGHFFETLEFRHQMHKAFGKSEGAR